MIRQQLNKKDYLPIKKIGDKIYCLMWNKVDEDETEYCTCVVENIRMPKNGSNIIEMVNKGKKVGYGEPSIDVWLAWVQNGNPFGFRLDELKEHILGAINKEIDEKILSGFVWKDMSVWLSSENQFNYKAAYDLAVMSQGKTLPTVFKFGSTENPVYYAFESLEDISDFYISAMAYINTTLAEGWKQKDSIDWGVFEESLNV